MKKWIDDNRIAQMLMRMSIARLVLFTMTSLIASFMTANATVSWTSLSNWERFLVILGCFGSWANTMIAWIDKTSSQVAKGQLPFGEIPPGSTEQIKKSDVSPSQPQQ